MEKEYYTVRDLEKKFNVSRQAIWQWIKLGKLKAFKIGRLWRIRSESLKDFIKESK